MQRAMQGMNTSSTSTLHAGGIGGIGSSNSNRIPLESIITAEEVLSTGILDDPNIRATLIPFLPEGQQSDEYLEQNLRSSQFRQSLGSLTSALNSENYSSVLANLGPIDPSPGMQQFLQGDGVGAFLTSLQAANPAENETEQNNPSNNKDNDDAMEE